MLLFGLSAILNPGCITYYRPDTFSGLNPAQMRSRHTLSTSYSHYTSSAYFDARDRFPHSSRTETPDHKFTRDDVILQYTPSIASHARLAAWLPITHLRQASAVDGVWRVDHLWLGILASTRTDQLTFISALGIPLSSEVDSLVSTTADEESDVRFMLGGILANRPSPRHWAYYGRIAGVVHFESNPNVNGLYELQGEGHLAAPIGPVHLGIRLDTKFTLIDDKSDQSPLSHDTFAVGPIVSLPISNPWGLSVYYRSEIFGANATAGSSFRITLDRN
jgi:hypothetical protein